MKGAFPWFVLTALVGAVIWRHGLKQTARAKRRAFIASRNATYGSDIVAAMGRASQEGFDSLAAAASGGIASHISAAPTQGEVLSGRGSIS